MNTNMGACGVQERDLCHSGERSHRDQRHRNVSGRSCYCGPLHGPRHWRIPSQEGSRPASQLND